MLDAMALALEHVRHDAARAGDGSRRSSSPTASRCTRSCAISSISERKATEQYEWSAKTYYPNGQIPEVGEMFRQPNLARTLRAIVAADKAAFAKSHNRVAAIRAGRDAFYKGDIARRIADANKAAGGVFTYEDLAVVPRQRREADDDELPRLRRLQGRTVEPGPGAAADAEHPRRRRSARRSARTPPTTSTRCTRRSSSPTPIATRYLRRSGVRDGADHRPAVEAVRRRAARADRTAGVARASRRRSVPVRSGREAAGRAVHAALAGRATADRRRATRPASTSSTRTATCSARRRAPAGCSAARSSRATPACRCRTG